MPNIVKHNTLTLAHYLKQIIKAPLEQIGNYVTAGWSQDLHSLALQKHNINSNCLLYNYA